MRIFCNRILIIFVLLMLCLLKLRVAGLNSHKPLTMQSAPMKLIKNAIASSSIIASLQFTQPTISWAASAVTTLPVEIAVTNLERSQTRADTLNTMADLYESTASKSLLAKAKYKTRIINALNDKRVSLSSEWDQALGYASGELKRRVDPFRTVDLKGYLSIAPFVGGAVYLASLFVQQAIPELFVFAYPAAVFVFVAPIIYIVLST